MSRRTAFLLFATLASTLNASACTSTTEEDVDEGALGAESDTLDVTTLAAGLLAEPSSPSRKDAAAQVTRMMKTVAKQIAPVADRERAADQEFTQRLVDYTAQYLASGEACDERQKIRVYRGIGSGAQPVLRATVGERKHGLHVAKPMMDAMRRMGIPSPARDATGMNALNGVDLYKALVTEKKPLVMRIDSDPAAAKALDDRIVRTSAETRGFSAAEDQSLSAEQRASAKRLTDELKETIARTDFGFSFQFGLNRTYMNFDLGEQVPVNLEFTAIAADHTQGAPWGTGAGSPFSPLISTSVNAIEKWGPMFLVADVCPERAPMSTSHVDATEQEVYLPLFILPEEIVAITTTLEELRQVAPPAAGTRPLDAAYRACFSQETATPHDGMRAYREVVGKKLPLREFRSELAKVMPNTCTRTTCPTGCVASNYCKDAVSRDPIKSAMARYIGDLPCVEAGPGCKVDGCP